MAFFPGLHGIPILSSEDSRQWEKEWFARPEAPAVSPIIQRVGKEAARHLAGYLRETSVPPKTRLKTVCIAGKGHNAADAFATLASLAASHGFHPHGLLVLSSENLQPETEKWFHALLSQTGPWEVVYGQIPESALMESWDLGVDGVLGMGFQAGKTLPPILNHWNRLCIHSRVAMDMPSGLSTSQPLEGPEIPRADLSLACGIPKKCLFDPEVQHTVGRIAFCDAGFFTNEQKLPEHPSYWLADDVLQLLRIPRKAFAHKRDFGHLLVLGGSLKTPGALFLAASAALIAGAGLVTATVPRPLLPAAAARFPDIMWLPRDVDQNTGAYLPEKVSFTLEQLGRKPSAVLIGPGLSPAFGDGETMEWLHSGALPCILDASGLTPGLQKMIANRPGNFPVTLTPHPGEWKRLNQENAHPPSPREFARQNRCICLLKGATTTITDGKVTFFSGNASPVLAKGGSGDVLAGIIAGIQAANTLDTLTATLAAQAWHSAASRYLASRVGQRCGSASQLIETLPHALNGA